MRAAPYAESLAAAAPEPSRIGGKGASLARLVQIGHRVPPGLVVTVDAFLATIRALGVAPRLRALEDAVARGAAPPAEGAAVQLALLEGRLPEAVIGPIRRLMDELRLWKDNPAGVIVRSSATSEDTAGHSFAGIYESYPIRRPEDLEPAIRRVWASAFSPRALAYVRERGLGRLPAIGVVIQRFLEADRSGVMFTRFPDPAGAPKILIEHVDGGCEKLVRGEVSPERLWLDPLEAGPEQVTGPLALSHARSLARLASDVERLFGSPQDVEWVLWRGAVHLVQSRPITTAYPPVTPPRADRSTGVAALLRGVGASPGIGSGEVHLAFNIEHALALAPGKVLVTPMTNPDMVVAMRNSSAIVTDVGGMICHAAIVSRELGLPCVVGTERATSELSDGQLVTVDGWDGAVYPGARAVDGPAATRPVEWPALWNEWEEVAGRPDVVPMVWTADALEATPPGHDAVVLVPDVDLRADPLGLWCDLEGMSADGRAAVLDRYVHRLSGILDARPVSRLFVRPPDGLLEEDLAEAIGRAGDERIRASMDRDGRPGGTSSDGASREEMPISLAAPLAAGRAASDAALGGVDESIARAVETITFFGHRPAVRVCSMPEPGRREAWWMLLPEYARYHREHGTAVETGAFEWLEVRPEVVISPLLKSLVQPGFEMVPRIMGFRDMAPLHTKWVRCRYHFRSDRFAEVWEAIVRATWDRAYMADLMRRVRASYDRLAEVLLLFPAEGRGMEDLSGDRVIALITSWWPRWVEFFALCWFIQAQGDDVLYPFVAETVRANLARVGDPPEGMSWPPVTDLVAPTTPVMSAEYMSSVGRLRDLLEEAGLVTPEEALRALDAGEAPDLAAMIDRHLAEWKWMRDRDLLFEPWDTPKRVIATALQTRPHSVPDYGENLRRNLLALAFHVDLAGPSGRATGLNHAGRFLHDLNVERENHHVLWLKFSYPLRRLVLEVERRFIAAGGPEPGDVFFLQAPELIDAIRMLPGPLPDALLAQARNRRAGYRAEARLTPLEESEPIDEDDYY
ncbi:MAG: hypothetical protein H0W27_01735 [Actinobacteria bacterium]|nr:hypothetical protein [Actinomycetota bacterium]